VKQVEDPTAPRRSGLDQDTPGHIASRRAAGASRLVLVGIVAGKPLARLSAKVPVCPPDRGGGMRAADGEGRRRRVEVGGGVFTWNRPRARRDPAAVRGGPGNAWAHRTAARGRVWQVALVASLRARLSRGSREAPLFAHRPRGGVRASDEEGRRRRAEVGPEVFHVEHAESPTSPGVIGLSLGDQRTLGQGALRRLGGWCF